MAAIFLCAFIPLLVILGEGQMIPVAVTGVTIDLFKVAGYLLAGVLTGYVFFTALQVEDE